MRSKALLPIWTAMLLCVSPLAAAERVAVVPVGGGEAAKLALLLESALRQRGVALAERAPTQPTLSDNDKEIAMTAEGAGARAKVGQSMGSDVLVFIRCLDKPTPRIEVSACETRRGLRLAHATIARADTAARDVYELDMVVADATSKAKQHDLKVVAVLPFESGDFSTRLTDSRPALRRIVEQSLLECDDVVLVELAEANSLSKLLAASGTGAVEREQPMVLAGRMKHSSMQPDSKITVTLNLTRGAEKLGEWNSGEVDPQAAPQLLPDAGNDLVEKSSGSRKPAAASTKVQAQDLAARARKMLRLGDCGNASELLEAAILLDPSNVAFHREVTLVGSELVDQEMTRAMAEAKPADDDETPADAREKACRAVAKTCADQLRVSLSHLEYFLDRTTLPAHWDFDRILLQRLIAAAPPTDVRETAYRILKYKYEHGEKDEFPRVLVTMLQQNNHFNQSNAPTLDEDADYVSRLADVWISGNPAFNLTTILSGSFRLSQSPAEMPQMPRVLKSMENSKNPETRRGAGLVRAAWEQAHAAQAATVQPPKSVAAARPALAEVAGSDVEVVPMSVPSDRYREHTGWATAGPHADIFYYATERLPEFDHFNVLYFRDDGWGRTLPRMTRGAPVFDGRFLWYTSVVNQAGAIVVYDTQADRVWTASVDQGLPPDPIFSSQLAVLEKGKVCVAALVGEQKSRTWVGMADMDPDKGPSFKSFLQCREKDFTSGENASIDCVFEPGFMFVLPGPPGSNEKATPHIYVARGMKRMLLIDPATLSCSLIDGKGLFGRRSLGAENVWGTAWHGKLYEGMTTWNPATDQWGTITGPPELNPKRVSSVAMYDGAYFVYADGYIYAGAPGDPLKKLKIRSAVPIVEPSASNGLEVSSIFGLLVNTDLQLKMIRRITPQGAPAAADPESWLKRHVAVSPDALGYQALADLYESRKDSDHWIAAMDGVIKYHEHDLSRAESEVKVANYLMSKGDYARARPYADDAATTGAKWAILSSAYVAEGLDDWESAEKLIREAGDGYHNPVAWLQWCCRTNHGDLESAKAQAARAVAGEQTSTDQELLTDAAVYYMLIDDKVKAHDVLRRLIAKDDLWAAMNAAILSFDEKDSAARGSAMSRILGNKPPSGPLMDIILMSRAAFNTGVPPRVEDVQHLIDSMAGINKVDGYYFAGQVLIIEGRKDDGIRYLKRAAGFNTDQITRTLAAWKLRSMGIDPPKPGMILQ